MIGTFEKSWNQALADRSISTIKSRTNSHRIVSFLSSVLLYSSVLASFISPTASSSRRWEAGALLIVEASSPPLVTNACICFLFFCVGGGCTASRRRKRSLIWRRGDSETAGGHQDRGHSHLLNSIITCYI